MFAIDLTKFYNPRATEVVYSYAFLAFLVMEYKLF